MPARSPRSSQTLLEQLVLAAFTDDAARSRADVERATGLSRAIVTGVVTQLLDAGELVVADQAEPTGLRGRPSTRYRRIALAAPVTLVRFDKDWRTRVARIDHDRATWAGTDEPAPWSAPWPEWSAALTRCLADLDHTAPADPDLVIAAPFPVVRGEGAPALPPGASHKIVFPEWLATDPRPRIADLTGRHVQLINDANLAALGEATAGVASGHRSVLYVLVRDGVGAGLVIDGTVVDGAHGMTGELAHVQVTEDGPFCVCGNRGCLATQTQDPRLIEVLSARYAHAMTWPDVEQLVAAADPLALRVLRDLGRLIGRALAAPLAVLDIEAVVLDGGLGSAAPPLIEGLRLELDHRCPPTIARGVHVTLGRLAEPLVDGAWAAAQQARTATTAQRPATPFSLRSGRRPTEEPT